MSNTETMWNEISTAALVGTLRKPFELTPAEGTLCSLLAKIAKIYQSSGSEAVLLRAASAVALHRRAGQLPPLSSPHFPTECPPDDWPRCSPRAGDFLEAILTGKQAMLPEWLELAVHHHRRVREEHLPALLESQKRNESLRRVLLPNLGARGRWLAAQNPDWSLFVKFQEEQAWAEGTRKERLAFLEELRLADPERARVLLEAAWAQETPGDRVAFLHALEHRLSMADESFLEGVLDDRRKDVRQAAAGLLARLSDSHLVRRMVDRSRRLITWKSGFLRASLEVQLPSECDLAMQRDGIESKPPAGSKMGEKAWWLAQIISMTPPDTWTSAWGKRPLAIFDLVRRHEWEEALLLGWSAAAERFADSEWLDALIEHELRRNAIPRIIELFPKLPAVRKEERMIELLRDNPSLSYDQPASHYLSACQHPWSLEMTQSVTTCICWTLQRGDFQPWRWEKLLRDIAPYFHPLAIQTAVERISAMLKKKGSADPPVDRLIQDLIFRLEMHQAFTTDMEDS